MNRSLSTDDEATIFGGDGASAASADGEIVTSLNDASTANSKGKLFK